MPSSYPKCPAVLCMQWALNKCRFSMPSWFLVLILSEWATRNSFPNCPLWMAFKLLCWFYETQMLVPETWHGQEVPKRWALGIFNEFTKLMPTPCHNLIQKFPYVSDVSVHQHWNSLVGNRKWRIINSRSTPPDILVAVPLTLALLFKLLTSGLLL